MRTLILDDDLKARLNNLNEYQEVRDAAGNVVGHFLPDESYRRLIYDRAKAEFALEEAEEAAKGIVRTWDGTNGRTTAQVMEQLRNLEEQLRRDEQARAAG